MEANARRAAEAVAIQTRIASVAVVPQAERPSRPMQVQITEVEHRATQLFHELDTDHDGFVTPTELMLGMMGDPYGMSEEEIARLFSKMDVNDDGLLELAEFCHGYQLLQKEGQLSREEKETLAQAKRVQEAKARARAQEAAKRDNNEMSQAQREFEERKRLKQLQKQQKGTVEVPAVAPQLWGTSVAGHDPGACAALSKLPLSVAKIMSHKWLSDKLEILRLQREDSKLEPLRDLETPTRLVDGFTNGVAITNVVEMLKGQKIKVKTNPLLGAFKLDNLAMLFEAVVSLGILNTGDNIAGKEFYDEKENEIATFCIRVIQKYDIEWYKRQTFNKRLW